MRGGGFGSKQDGGVSKARSSSASAWSISMAVQAIATIAQVVFGFDRDSGFVVQLVDERNPVVAKGYVLLIQVAKAKC
eukprot:10374079-Lingulodinium_polyedra.AAC.1